MEIVLTGVTKRFGREEVLRNVHHTFAAGSRTAVLGPNGSGKSTLLLITAGALTLSEGTVAHLEDGRRLDPEAVYRRVSLAAPYLGLYEDLTLGEAVDMHARFKPLRQGIGPRELARTAYLEDAWEKPVRNFSSGMKQRLKLALAILSDTPLLLLDEPASNLDAGAIAWYRQLLATHLDQRTLIVCSNRQAAEFDLCTSTVETTAFKG